MSNVEMNREWPKTEKDVSEKYRDIESKIPAVWPTWEAAALELTQDIAVFWDISDGELIRVITLMEIRVREFRQNQHINPMFAFIGLYPHMMKSI